MNQCLYCNTPCTPPGVFCEECRVSLLKRHHPLDEFLRREQSSPVSLLEQPPPGVVVSSYQDAVGILPTKVLSPAPMSVSKNRSAVSAKLLPRSLPRRMRVALLVFMAVGLLSLMTDAVLLVLNIGRHHSTNLSSSSALMGPPGTVSPGRVSTSVATPGARRGQGLATPSSSPGTGTPSSGTPSGGMTTTNKPLLALSSSSLTFMYTQGQANPVAQNVQISNAAGTPFSWHIVLPSSPPPWLSFAPAWGSVSAGNSGQVTVYVNVGSSQLSLGLYKLQVSIQAMDNTGVQLQNSPQTLSVFLTVFAPCSLVASPARLSFQASLLQSNPAAQTVTVNVVGNCVRPVSWKGLADAPWIVLSSSTGNDGGTGASFQVSVQTKGMLLGTYTAHVTVTAVDHSGHPVQSSPQTLTVTLSVVG